MGGMPDVVPIFNALQRPIHQLGKCPPQHLGRGKWGSKVPKVIVIIIPSLSA